MPQDNCPFCLESIDREFLISTGGAYAIYDKFPVSNGHVLVIPKRHCDSFFELTSLEQQQCLSILQEARTIIQKIYNPDGFNVGINVGRVAGQTVSHVHLHLIPRYHGDVDDPAGGVRAVIPHKQKY